MLLRSRFVQHIRLVLTALWAAGLSACSLDGNVAVDGEFLADFVASTNTKPSAAKVSVGTPSSLIGKSSTIISVPIYISDATYVDLSNSHVVLLKTGTVSCSVGLSGSGSVWTATVYSCSGDGTVSVQVAAKAARDAEGIYSVASSPSVTVSVDNTPPTLTIAAPSGYVNASTNSAQTISGTCSDNERLVNVSVTDGIVTLTGSATCTLNSWALTMNMSTLAAGSFTISTTMTDAVGHAGTNSTTVVKDITAPNAASSLGWSTSSPTGSTSLTATWTKSTSPDISTQKIQLFADGSCTSASGSVIDVASASSRSLTATAGNTYTYKITTIDTAGNTTVSSCSSSMTIVDVSLSQSTLALSSSSIQKGSTTTITLTAKSSAGVQASSGGLAVSFASTSGTSTMTFSSTTDHGNGTYSATVTGTGSGTAATIQASISGVGSVSSTVSLSVLNTAPVLSLLSQKVFPVDGANPPLIQGNSYTLASATDANSDTMTFTCTYQSMDLLTNDPNYAASGTSCTNLDTLTSSGSPATTYKSKIAYGSSSITWKPTSTQLGTFKFTISVSDGSTSSASQNLIVSVREDSTIANLDSYIDGFFAKSISGLSTSIGAAPYTDSDSSSESWLNLISAGNHGSLTFTSSNPWNGREQSSIPGLAPNALSFNGTGDSLSLGSIASSAVRFGLSLWMKATSPSSTDKAIIASSNGVTLEQSLTVPGKLELRSGTRLYYSYRDLINSEKPKGYWRLGETLGTTAGDDSGYSQSGTYTGTGGFTIGQAGAIVDSTKAVYVNGSTGYVNLKNNSPVQITGNISIEAWAKPASFPSVDGDYAYILGKGYDGTNEGYFMRVNNSGGEHYLEVGSWPGGGPSRYYITSNWNVGEWAHIVGTYDGSYWRLYVDGDMKHAEASATGPLATASSLYAGAADINGSMGRFFNGYIDEVAVYNYALTQQQVTNHYQTGLNGNYVPYPPNDVLADKPFGYWRFSEESGSTAYDSSSNGNNGTYIGATTLSQSGYYGEDSAAKFNGSTAGVNMGNTGAWPETTPFTVTARVKLTGTDTSTRTITSKFKATGYNTLALLKSASNEIVFTTGDGSAHDLKTSAVSAGTWYNIAAVWDGTKKYLYLDGVQIGFYTPTTAQKPTSGAYEFTIGYRYDGVRYFNGTIDEVAVFDYPLSFSRIFKYHTGKSQLSSCISSTKTANSWNLIQTLWDANYLSLYVNGRKECSFDPSLANEPATGVGTVVLGSGTSQSSGFWQGLVSSFKAFGTGDTPASSTTFRTDFAAEANRFRRVLAENVVTNGLVLHLDPANADQGIRPYANGCETSDLVWYDMTAGIPGSLYSGFTGFGCVSSKGWQGGGSPSVYKLMFDGSSTMVRFQNVTALPTANQPRSVSFWFNTSDASLTNQTLFNWGTTTTSQAYGVSIGNSSGTTFISNTGWLDDLTVNTSITNGAWTHVTVTFDGVTATLYKNGTQIGTASKTSWNTASTLPLILGSTPNNLNYFKGSLATMQFYNRSLTTEEVKQNCLAQETRYTATAQSICAAP